MRSQSHKSGLRAWVQMVAEHAQPDTVHWWMGTDEERARAAPSLAKAALDARRNDATFDRAPVVVSTPRRVDAGPTNIWISRDDALAGAWPLLRGAMRRRTMYVVPYMLGAPRSPFCRVGVQVTDSPEIVAAIDATARTGRSALDELERSVKFARGLHCLAEEKGRERLILHFPDSVETWSIGSGSLTNALLCSGTEGRRLASAQAREEGWLAEHMTLYALTDPAGETSYLALAAADGGGGAELDAIAGSLRGWKLCKLGGDSCWMRPGEDGRLRAICPDQRAWEPSSGAPLGAIVFCGRQSRSTPIVYEARSWRHGVYVGATLMSEVEGTNGASYNPMSMLASCGYNMGDYFAHWLSIGRKLHYPPKIFHLNWFRADGQGQRLWPGGHHNLRILEWIAQRSSGTIAARSSPVGLVPELDSLDSSELELSPDRLQQLLTGNQPALLRQAESARKFLSTFGDCLPPPLLKEHRQLVRRLQESLN